ncbi:hypothetical protein IFR05_015619, partial [Cadophora sp. M221]
MYPVGPRTTQVARNFPRASGSWKSEHSGNNSSGGSVPIFKDVGRQVKVSMTESTPKKFKD